MFTALHAGSRACVAALAMVCLGLPLRAQQAHSVVSGHVVCADTNAPARLAKVTLNPLRNFNPKTVYDNNAVPGVMTDMDGAFSVRDVPAGRYLVLVELPGYVSGIAGLDEHARQHMRDAVQAAPEGSAIVDVANGLPATVDISLERGAAVSGTIRYDDGSPAIGILVGLEHRNSRRAWEPALESTLQTFSFFSKEHDGSVVTDSAGQFRIDGLPPGEYIVHAHLAPQIITLPVAGDGAVGVYEHPGVQLDVYSGGAFWRNQAKPITVGRGDEVEADMEIPLGKLRTVSGSVVSAADGRAVSTGRVTLSLLHDAEEVRSMDIANDGSFRFLYVPEGDYLLRAEDAAAGMETQGVPNAPSARLILFEHQYGKAETVVHVGEEMVNVTVAVPEGKLPAAQ